MSQQVRKGEELDKEKLRFFLYQNELVKSVQSSLEISQYSNGYSNLTYQLDIENRTYVLRRPPAGAIKRGHDMGREYKVLSRLKKGFEQCPEVYVYSEGGDVMNVPFYIMEKIDGVILTSREAQERSLGPPQFKTIAQTWLDTFVRFHALDYKSLDLSDLGRPEGYVMRQVSNWSKQYRRAATSEVAEAQKVMSWLEQNQPQQYDHTLIHNDFKYDNVVFSDSSWNRIEAVLDWEMCTLGDPLMDLGTSLGYWTMATDGEMVRKGLPSPTMYEGNPGRLDIVNRYALASGREINHLIFYYVFGLFKIAVIAQQIFYRYHNGLTTDKKFAYLDKSSQFLCLCALQAIQKNKIEDLF